MKKINKIPKIPKPIKAMIIVNKDKPKLDVYNSFDISAGGVKVEKDERKCLVEVKFIKWL